MHIGMIVAMEEELTAILAVIPLQKVNKIFTMYEYKKDNLVVSVIISKIGKAAAAAATTYLIENYNPQIIVNIGTCGGVNQANLANIILTNSAAYHDVDVTGFGYKLGQLPSQPEIFHSPSATYNFQELYTFFKKSYPVLSGTLITGDQFVANKNKVNTIKNMYPNTVALDMEGAAIAQICLMYNKSFIFLKKVSDLADHEATDSFKDEILNMNQQIPHIVQALLDYFP